MNPTYTAESNICGAGRGLFAAKDVQAGEKFLIQEVIAVDCILEIAGRVGLGCPERGHSWKNF